MQKKRENILFKLNYLLSKKQKIRLGILGFLLIIGIFFEMLGLGVILPSLGLMVNSNIAKDYPILKPLLKQIGNPSQTQLVFYGVFFYQVFVSLFFLSRNVQTYHHQSQFLCP